MGRFCEPALLQEEFRANKYNFNFVYSCKWICLLQDGKSVVQYFKDNNIQEITLYGMGELGKRLYKDLQESGVIVKYVIDRDKKLQNEKYTLLSPEDDFPQLETIVVTAPFEFQEIREALSKKTDAKIISLKEIIDEVV